MNQRKSLFLEPKAVHEGQLRDGNLAEHARDGGQVDVAMTGPRLEPGRWAQAHHAIVSRLGLLERRTPGLRERGLGMGRSERRSGAPIEVRG